MKKLLLMALAGLGACSGCADARPPLKTVDHVDLQRYTGTWYVIANIPYWLENGKVATADRYALRPDGKMDNIFVFRREKFDAPEEEWKGVGWVHNHTTNAEWRVRFIWPMSIPYLIIDLDPEYRWAVIGHPSRDYFWVLARTRQLDESIYQGIVARAAVQGYDTTQFAKVPQPIEPVVPEVSKP